jgi:DNA invertase Pin-like site-specific DNA recombinase
MSARAHDAALPTRVAIYVRLSKEDVRGKSLGIESCAVQQRDAREGIEREGWTVDQRHVFVDDGVSGTKANRDAWQAMLAAAKRREFDVVAVRDLDRFSRLDPVRTLAVIRDLSDVGVKLWSYRERQCISVDGDQVVFTAMRARQAAAEAEKASERITAGLRARARDGRATARAPFGYRTRTVTEQDVADARKAGDEKLRAGKWWVKHEPELEVVRHVVAVFCETLSYSATARALNEEGTRSPSGKQWAHVSAVKSIVGQPAYRGYKMHKGDRIEHPDLAIFTAAEVRRIDAAMARASTVRPWAAAERKSGRFNLAVPFVACGVCGSAIVATGSAQGGRSYLCDRQRTHACRGVGYRSADRVDEALVRAVDNTLTPEAIATVCALVKDVESQPSTRGADRQRIAREITAA